MDEIDNIRRLLYVGLVAITGGLLTAYTISGGRLSISNAVGY